MKIAFFGASGYGNVGDDTYPLVIAQQLPEHELVFYNSDLPASLPDDLGMLVIGGGGVLHNVGAEPEDAESPHFRCMKFYLDAAIARGIPWGFISCGFQFAGGRDAAYAVALKPWAPYLKQAKFITLRSSSCARIAREISGTDHAVCFPDAAYLYQTEMAERQAAANTVTLVPAGYVNPRNALVNHHLRQLVSSGLSITWLGMGAPIDDDPLFEHAARCFPASTLITRPSPQAAFDCIARSRFVITGRYHGMVFARTSRVPFITPLDVPYKMRVEDLTADIATAAGHFDVLRNFLRR